MTEVYSREQITEHYLMLVSALNHDRKERSSLTSEDGVSHLLQILEPTGRVNYSETMVMEVETTLCETCDGLGRVATTYATRTCTACKGKGKVASG